MDLFDFMGIKRRIREQVWTDTQIELYERQMAAREALGAKWCCHPAKHVGRLPTAPCVRQWYRPAPTGAPKLWVVK